MMMRLLNFTALAATVAVLAASPALALPAGGLQTTQPEPEPLMPEARRAAIDTLHEQRRSAWSEWATADTHQQRRGDVHDLPLEGRHSQDEAVAAHAQRRSQQWSDESRGAPDTVYEQRRSEESLPNLLTTRDAAGSAASETVPADSLPLEGRHARD